MTATLRFDVVSNGAPARRDLAATRREVDSFGKSTDRVGRQTEASRGKLSRFGGAIGAAAKTFGPLAVAAAGVAIVKFGVDAVKAASDTQQAFGAVDAVFGRNSAKVKAWANGAVSDVGLARGEYAQLAATLGASLKNAGVEQFDVKTRGLIRTAADLAAQFGGSTSDAVSALGSLMRGEADPIERYGVSIKQSDVNARLAALGQDKLTGAARKQAEMQARLALVTKQTKDSQGAFRRESTTLAGQQQRLAANFQNVKDKLGQALIPVLARGLAAVNRLFSGGGRLSGAMKTLGGIVKSYATPVIAALRGAVDRVRSSFTQAGGKGDGLRTALKVLGTVAKFLAGILGKTLGAAITTIARVAGTTLGAIDRLVSGIQRVVSWSQSAMEKIGSLVSKAKSIGSLGGILRGADGSLGGLARGVATNAMSGAPFRAPPINLVSSPSVKVEVDSQAMARLFRVIVRDELQHVGYSRGYTP